MSLVRAFTTRGKKPEAHATLPMGRAASHRNGKPVIRAQISSPVALVSTTNMISYSAPDINGLNRRDFSASTTSSTSGEDSDASANSIHSNDTHTDMSSIDESPTCPSPNHLSSYFKPAVDTSSNSPNHSPSLSASASFEGPTLPKRAPSHSKHAHESVSRKRSVQRLQSPPESARASASSEFTPSLSASVEAPRENPFGKELEQLDEIAEEFGQTVRNAEHDADAAYMRSRNLGAFAASDYLNEIHGLIVETFQEQHEAAAWF